VHGAHMNRTRVAPVLGVPPIHATFHHSTTRKNASIQSKRSNSMATTGMPVLARESRWDGAIQNPLGNGQIARKP
jgi:hypothetical protein